MPKVILQIGHWNIEKITKTGLRSWRDVNYLKTSTGASGERDYHYNKLLPLLKAKLEKAGIEVVVADAIYSGQTIQKADLWISLHYDGGGVENRSMVSSPLRGQGYLNSKAHDLADKFAEIWRGIYPQHTGTINRNERITAGMLEYYAFDYVEMNTPAVIIEHFNHTSDKGAELKGNPEKVAHADYMAIMKFFGLGEEPTLDTFTIETDIPTTVEEKYRLKDIQRYNNRWKFGELIQDWVVIAKSLLNVESEKTKLVNDHTKAINDKNTEIQTLNTKIASLESKIKVLESGNLKNLEIGDLIMMIWNKIKNQKLT